MQDLLYRQEVLLYQKFVIENKSEKERTEKRKTMSNILQEQIEMEEEVRESIKKMYPSDPDHLYRKMALEFYSCDFEKRTDFSLADTGLGIKPHVYDAWRSDCSSN